MGFWFWGDVVLLFIPKRTPWDFYDNIQVWFSMSGGCRI